MKVKLLKKIRKRYSIVRYDNIGTNPNNFLKESKEKYGLPFYVLSDDDIYSGRYHSSRNLSELKEYILRYVRRDFTHKIKPVKEIKSKVWYV